MSTNAVIIDPTGQARQVPSDKVDMYVKLGAKPARPVMDPQGQARYVSEDRYMDALNAGGRPYQPGSGVPVPAGLRGAPDSASATSSPTLGSTPGEILSTIGQHAKNLIAGPIHAFTAPPQNPREQAVAAATSNAPGGSQISLALDRILGVSNSVQTLQNARNLTGDAKVQAYEDAVPVVGPWAKQIETDVQNKGAVAGLAGLATDVLLPSAAPKAMGAVASGISDVAERARGYTSPVIDPQLQAASKVATAVRPQAGIGPDFEATLKTQLPAILDYANRTTNPMHSQWEAGTAARGLAEEGLNHYKTNILGPHADATVPMNDVPEYQGSLDSEGRASLQNINDRIGSINDYIRAAQRNAKTGGQQMSATEKLGLDTEASKLRSTLYSQLGKRTGIDPADIQALRSNYGQQFDLADTIDAARRSRLGQIGATQEAGSGIALNKAGLLEKALTRIRGGQQYLADSNFRDAMGSFEPSPANYPRPAAPDSQAASVNRVLAQQEYLHQSALSQAAQDAAASRSSAAAAYRVERKKSFGESMRSKSSALRSGLSGR